MLRVDTLGATPAASISANALPASSARPTSARALRSVL
uniref:Uncharacterized protein n=1 Tax=Arundo donax TaxID=35708 RepID=A0A0A9DNH7_ARUDO